jgi:hypothetical protein
MAFIFEKYEMVKENHGEGRNVIFKGILKHRFMKLTKETRRDKKS